MQARPGGPRRCPMPPLFPFPQRWAEVAQNGGVMGQAQWMVPPAYLVPFQAHLSGEVESASSITEGEDMEKFESEEAFPFESEVGCEDMHEDHRQIIFRRADFGDDEDDEDYGGETGVGYGGYYEDSNNVDDEEDIVDYTKIVFKKEDFANELGEDDDFGLDGGIDSDVEVDEIEESFNLEGEGEIVLVDAWASKLVVAAQKRHNRLVQEANSLPAEEKQQHLTIIPEPLGEPPNLDKIANQKKKKGSKPNDKKKKNAKNIVSAREKNLYKRYGPERGKRIALSEMALDAIFAVRAARSGHLAASTPAATTQHLVSVAPAE
mmetsp:Transcript_17044/g.33325  ORF Transcript_17044/g.33325 Transcript_17044/m.33325 type:complete len:321 (-) Transcript_17044:1299-2261(-)